MKKFKKIFVFVFMFCLSISGVWADFTSFPTETGTITQGNVLGLNSNGEFTTVEENIDKDKYTWFHKKSVTSYDVICVSGVDVTPPSGKNCTKDDSWTLAQSMGVAYIIRTFSWASTDVNYYWAELLINDFLNIYSKSAGTYMYNDIINNSNYTLASTGKTWNQILEGANAASIASTNNISLTLSTNSLKFAKNSDGYYYSNPITISSNGSYTVSLSNSNFSYDKSDNTYTFKILSSKIPLGTTASFNATFTSSEQPKTYYTAQRYNCGGEVQDVTIARVIDHSTTVASPITISGSVKKQKASIKIAKVNSKDKFIAGAKLMLQTKAQRDSGQDGSIYTSSNTSYITVDNLVEGKYYLTEKEAPSGYDKTDEIIEIDIDVNGNIKKNGETNNGTLKVINSLTQTKFSKIDATTGKELPGATLQVLDKEKKPIYDIDGNEIYKWISTDTPFLIEGLPAGKYFLKEIIAPEGYTKTESMVEFEVKGDGTITKVVMKNSPIIEVENTGSSISMLTIFWGFGLLVASCATTAYIVKKRNSGI